MQNRIPVGMIRQPESVLRKVDFESPEYLKIEASVAQYGVLEPIQVAGPLVDAETGEEYYERCNGNHRYAAACQAGHKDIPCHIIEIKDKADMLIKQAVTNLVRVETKPVEYTKQMLRIMDEKPLMTLVELADLVNQSLTWVRQRLKLAKIEDENIVSLIDEGKINLQNAYALATLPLEEQSPMIDSAITQDSSEFVAAVVQRNKELKEAKRIGAPEVVEFPGATAKGRSNKDLKEALTDISAIKQVIPEGADADTIILETLKWTLHLDAASEANQRAKWEAAQSKKEETKTRSKEKTEKLKIEKQLAKAEQMKAEAIAAMNSTGTDADAATEAAE